MYFYHHQRTIRPRPRLDSCRRCCSDLGGADIATFLKKVEFKNEPDREDIPKTKNQILGQSFVHDVMTGEVVGTHRGPLSIGKLMKDMYDLSALEGCCR